MFVARTVPDTADRLETGNGYVDSRAGLRPPHQAALCIDAVDDPVEMRALEADWRALFDECENCSYFQSFDYLFAAWECVARPRGRGLKIVVGRHFGRVVVIWPLITFSRRHARWLGSEKTEYRDALVLPGPHAEAWLLETWNFIQSALGFDWVLLQDIKKGSSVDSALATYADPSQKNYQPSRLLECDAWGSWDSFFASRGRKLRSDQRRQWRRLEKLGQVRFQIVEDDFAIEATINWMIDRKIDWLDRRGLKERNFRSGENRKFLVVSARDAQKNDNLFLAKLCVDDVMVAVVYAIVFRSAMTFICFSYDYAYESYSPARLAMSRMLEWAFENSLSSVDFMPGMFEYKYAWTNNEFDVFDWRVPCSKRGRVVIRWHDSRTRRLLVDLHARLSAGIPPRFFPPGLRKAVRRALMISQ